MTRPVHFLLASYSNQLCVLRLMDPVTRASSLQVPASDTLGFP